MSTMEKTFNDGEIIIREGDTGNTFFQLLGGKAAVYKNYGKDDEVQIAIFEPGQYFGEMAVIENYPRSATVVALGEAQVVEIAAEELNDYFTQNPEKIISIMEVFGSRIKKMTDDWGPMMETFLANRKNLRVVVQLVDIRHEPTAQDRQMYDYLRHYNMSGVIVATKSDKIKRSQLGKSMAAIRKTLDLTDEDIIIPVSALKREGQDKLLEVMEQILKGE